MKEKTENIHASESEGTGEHENAVSIQDVIQNEVKPPIEKLQKEDKLKKKKKKKHSAAIWTIVIFATTLLLSFSFSLVSEVIISSAHIAVAIIVLLLLIIISIIFDVIGVAFTSCDIAPFHAMAAKKVKGAKKSMELLKKADRVSNICADVIGDICGIVSGSAGAAIAIIFTHDASAYWQIMTAILISSVVASLTVGGKSIGKNIAIKYSQKIVLFIGKLLSVFGKK